MVLKIHGMEWLGKKCLKAPLGINNLKKKTVVKH